MAEVKDLRQKARFLDAWELLSPYPPPEEWTDGPAKIQASRLIRSLGGSQRSSALVFRTWRHRATRSSAREDMFWQVLERRGPFLAWQWLQKHPAPADATNEERADHEGTKAYALALLRDFERAHQCVDTQILLDPESGWPHLMRSEVLSKEDRKLEALEAAEHALTLGPQLISALLDRHDLLIGLGQEERALKLLSEVAPTLQSAALYRALHALQMERELFDEARSSMDQLEILSPLRDEPLLAFIAARRCDLASAMGDHDEALKQAEAASKIHGFYEKVAGYLRQAKGDLKRTTLPVGFVQQHYNTCAPAIVSAIASYFHRPVEHIDLANEICYDGTPDYKERNWAERNGWVVREFRVTVASAMALIDHGIPIILNTVAPDSAHAQAIIGYDTFRQVLFVRDPSFRVRTEFLALEALEGQAPFGPRGFVMVPPEQAPLLEGLDLPESALYDLKHEFDLALDRHDREAAMAIVTRMRTEHTNERMRWSVELALARYDNNTQARKDGLTALLEIHPGVINWELDRLNAIRDLHGREAYTEALRESCTSKDAHPLLLRALGRELHWEAKHQLEGERLINRVHRKRIDAIAVLTTANIAWDRRQLSEATDIYRLAACLDDKNLFLGTTYFKAARWTRRTEEALNWFRRIYRMDGGRSADPALALAEALGNLNQDNEAMALLREARERRPNDPRLGMELAERLLSAGQPDQARAVLAEVASSAAPIARHRLLARLARYEADNHAELQAWRTVLEINPLAMDAHRSIVRLLEHLEGRSAALAHSRAACERFPYHWDLHSDHLDLVRQDGDEPIEAATRDLLRIDAKSAYAWRELALLHRRRGDYAAAHEALAESLSHDPNSPWHYRILGSVLEQEGRVALAREAYQTALALDIDATANFRALLNLCESTEERNEAIAVFQSELSRQVTNGDCILDFRRDAGPHLTPDAMESILRSMHADRPDLWQSSVGLAQHLRDHGQGEESIRLMEETCERFPLLPRVWAEMAECHGWNGDRSSEVAALKRVRELNPAWGYGMRLLAGALSKNGQYADAVDVLNEALQRDPTDSRNHGWIAETLWHLGRREESIAHLKKAVEFEPEYTWAWMTLRDHGPLVGEPQAARLAAEALTRERPAVANSWSILADMLEDPQFFDQQIAALDQVIALDPYDTSGYDDKALRLSKAGRFDDALAVCAQHPGKPRPAQMLAREAWILWMRGDRKAAIEKMQAAIERDPGHTWGIHHLSGWQEEEGDLKAAAAYMERLVALERRESGLHVRLGSLKSRLEDKDGALEQWRRALEIDPQNEAALDRILDHHRDRKEHQPALDLLHAYEPHFSPIDIQSRRFVLLWHAAKLPDAKDAMLAAFAQNLGHEKAYTSMFDAVEAAGTKAHRKELHEAAGTAIRDGNYGNTFVGVFYFKLSFLLEERPDLETVALVDKEDLGATASLRALFVCIGASAQEAEKRITANRRLKRLHAYFLSVYNPRRAYVQREFPLWGVLTYTLNCLERQEDTIVHTAGYERRSEMETYVINNIYFAFLHLDRRHEARKCLEHALSYPSVDSLTSRLRIHAAIWAFLGRRTDEGRRLFESVVKGQLNDEGNKEWRFGQLLLQQAPGEPRRRFSAESRKTVSEFRDLRKKSKGNLHMAQELCTLAARHNRSPWPWIWYAFEYRPGWSWVMSMILLALIRVLFMVF